MCTAISGGRRERKSILLPLPGLLGSSRGRLERARRAVEEAGEERGREREAGKEGGGGESASSCSWSQRRVSTYER